MRRSACACSGDSTPSATVFNSKLRANRCAFKLDLRLSVLAADAGAVYSRYAGDLAFSGGR